MNIEGVTVEVVRKKMKNLRLVVKPPNGYVRVSAPLRASRGDIHTFVSANIAWIKEQQQRISQTKYPEPPKYIDGEIHNLWGEPKKLCIMALDDAFQNNASKDTFNNNKKSNLTASQRSRYRTFVSVEENHIVMHVPSFYTPQQRQKVLHSYYRDTLNEVVPSMIAEYASRLGVWPDEWRIKNMKTRWGTCNIQAKRIWLNLMLAQYPKYCLEYVVVHELAHLLERYHNRRFWGIVASCYPAWQEAKARLNGNQNECV